MHGHVDMLRRISRKVRSPTRNRSEINCLYAKQDSYLRKEGKAIGATHRNMWFQAVSVILRF